MDNLLGALLGTNNLALILIHFKNINIKFGIIFGGGMPQWYSEPRTQLMLLVQITVVQRTMNPAADCLFEFFRVHFHYQHYIFSVESANILVLSVSRMNRMVCLFEYFRIRCNRRQFIFYVESINSLNKCFQRTQRKLIGSNHSDIAKKIAKIILFSVQSTSSLVISISMMKRMVSLFESFRVY